MFKDTPPGAVFTGTPTMTLVYYDQVKEFLGKLLENILFRIAPGKSLIECLLSLASIITTGILGRW